MYKSQCYTCGARLVWLITEKGRKMPCESEPVPFSSLQSELRYAVKQNGRGCSVKMGKEILDNFDGSNASDDAYFIPHWGNCNAPDHHRRNK